jgi:Tol biopolymer transport system component
VFAAPAGESYELFTCDLADPDSHQLTTLGRELGFPVWSPNGDRIAFIAMSEHTADLMVLDTRTGSTSILLAGYNELADWGPQGERLLVGLENGLHFLDIATGDLEAVETGSTADAYGRCARNADLIAYESGRDGNPEIYVTFLDTGETTRLTENSDLDEWPSPSRDGGRIAWASGTEEDKNLWVMNSDGSEKRQITEDLLLGDAFPEWSPDGSRILFTANEADGFVLKLLDLATGEITDLGAGTAPSWR